MNDIVVRIDRSETAARALTKAASMATAQRANLHIITCVDRDKPVDITVGTDRFHTDAGGGCR